jgi:Uma2 family endonuclease
MIRESIMQIEAIRRPFTVDEYDRMVEVGILGKEDHVELIEGEILEMSPIGSRHEACVDRAAVLLLPPLVGQSIVRVQGSIRLGDYSRPQPDLILLQHRRDYYAPSGAVTRDALLVIEVSDTSIRYDRGPKLRVYARHGVREVWIEDLTTDTLLVFRSPEGATYRTLVTLKSGDSIAPEAFPQLIVSVAALLGLDLDE